MLTTRDVYGVTYSGDLRADSLLTSQVDWNFLLPARSTLYYTFARGGNDAPATAPLTEFNVDQKAAAVSILNHVTSVTGIPFVEVATSASADFHFAACDLSVPSTAGETWTPVGWTVSGNDEVVSYSAEAYIYLDNVECRSLNASPAAGTLGYQVLLHEIGHALGLGHPFDDPYKLPVADDNTNNTVMSYTAAGAPKSTFQSYDLLALRWLYGDDGLDGSWGFDSTHGPSLTNTLIVPGKTLVGTRGNDSLTGGAGDDVFNGDAGVDTVRYLGAKANFKILRTSTGYTVTDSTRGEGADTLNSVERLQFADKTLAFDIDGTAGQVYRLYQAAFHRTPDQVGLGGWIKVMDNAMPLSQVATGFINSAEFKALYGSNPTNEQFVTLLYDNVLHRAPDTKGYNDWMRGLSSGMTREQALIGFSESTENKVALMAFSMDGNLGQVYRLYQAAFDRKPDVGGVDNWTQGMDKGMTLNQVATGFINSAEFKGLYGSNPSNAEFVTLLYGNVLHRAPDTKGYSDWMTGLSSGTSREDVLIGFSESLENQLALVGIVQSGIEYV